MPEEYEDRNLHISSATADKWIRLDRARVVLHRSHSGSRWNQVILGLAMVCVGNWIQLMISDSFNGLFFIGFVLLLVLYFIFYRFLLVPRWDEELENESRYYPGLLEQARGIMKDLKGLLQTSSGTRLAETGFDMNFALGDLKINVSGRGSDKQ